MGNWYNIGEKMESMILNSQEALEILKALIKLYPQNQPELEFKNNYELLCAVVLSAQTTDKSVNKISPILFDRYPRVEDMADADVNEIQEIIKSIGLSKNKSKYLKELSIELLENFNGQVPSTRKELMSLSGVGRKTANVLLANAFDIPAFAVDTHVNRICKKLKFVKEDLNVLQVEEEMMKKIPDKYWKQAHHSILLFGRHQCVAKNHDHSICLLRIKDKLQKNEIAQKAMAKICEGQQI